MPSDHSNPDHKPGLGALKVPTGMSYTSDIANSQKLPFTECPSVAKVTEPRFCHRKPCGAGRAGWLPLPAAPSLSPCPQALTGVLAAGCRCQ